MFIYNIDSNCPEIKRANWQKNYAEGWRWHGNAKANLEKQNAIYIEQLQYLHGPKYVTVGDPWDEEEMEPHRDKEFIGIYIRDVEDIIAEFIEEIHRWGVMEL